MLLGGRRGGAGKAFCERGTQECVISWPDISATSRWSFVTPLRRVFLFFLHVFVSVHLRVWRVFVRVRILRDFRRGLPNVATSRSVVGPLLCEKEAVVLQTRVSSCVFSESERRGAYFLFTTQKRFNPIAAFLRFLVFPCDYERERQPLVGRSVA